MYGRTVTKKEIPRLIQARWQPTDQILQYKGLQFTVLVLQHGSPMHENTLKLQELFKVLQFTKQNQKNGRVTLKFSLFQCLRQSKL